MVNKKYTEEPKWQKSVLITLKHRRKFAEIFR